MGEVHSMIIDDSSEVRINECKFSIGKNNNDIHGKFRQVISLVVVYLLRLDIHY